MIDAICPSSTRGSVFFLTLGCAKNEVDSEDMARLLREAGFQVVDDIDSADAVVVNTCSFICAAVEESIDAVLDLAEEPRVREREIPIIVAGCMPSRYGDDLAAELREASAFLPCANEGDIVEVVSACLRDRNVGEVHADRDALPEAGNEPSPWAYVKISDGCDRWCSYCTIPLIRGRYHSFSKEEIFDDVRRKVSSGVRECVLIGQDTGLWGRDFATSSSLAELLSSLADEFPDTWFRAMYTQPENVTDELLEAISSRRNIAPYLDIPMQHVDADILAAMNRKGSREAFDALIAQAREKVPGIALRTTLIAGFPGEDERAFEELVEFVEEASFDYVGVFPYSREEGTRAAEMDGQLDEEEKAYRAERLRTVADAVSASVIAVRSGSTYPVLVEGIEEDGQLFGRAIVQAPEVDGVTYLGAGFPGDVKNVRIDGTFLYDMEGVSE